MEVQLESGCLITLTSQSSSFSISLLVECVGKGIFLLSRPCRPFERLCLAQNGRVYFNSSSKDKGCLLMIEKNNAVRFHGEAEDETPCCFYVRSTAYKSYLALTSDGLASTNEAKEASKLRISVVDPSPTLEPIPSSRSLFSTAKGLSRHQLERFLVDGFVLCPGLVPDAVTRECIRMLNHYLATPSALVPGGTQGGSIGKFEGGIVNRSEIRNLFFRSLVASVVESLVGQFDTAAMGIQIAFRFPELGDSRALDLTSWHTDGLRQGKNHGFSLLVGICLSDVEEEFCGNLIVWPGSHRLLHRCKTGVTGGIDLNKLRKMIGNCDLGISCVEEITPQSSNEQLSLDVKHEEQGECKHNNEPRDLPPLAEPLQVKARIGDVVILHSDLAHTGGPNYSPEIRRMIYFRVRKKCGAGEEFESWEQLENSQLTDMWADISGAKQALCNLFETLGYPL